MFLTGCSNRWMCIFIALTGGLVMSRPLQKYPMGLQRRPSKKVPSLDKYVRNLETRASSVSFSARQASTDATVDSRSSAPQPRVQLKPTQLSICSPSRKKLATDLSTAIIALTIKLVIKLDGSQFASVSWPVTPKCKPLSSSIALEDFLTDAVVMNDSQFKKKHAVYRMLIPETSA
ncbi:hypothetical protein DFH28DRAFT_493791 [Melampsora americana]|nr:hypothetical protein DFH28DRAFT_493791 [Melampsora americana]